MYINEIFYSIQGEGRFTGVPAVFIRLQGCLCHCSFCDTKQSWKVPKPDDRRVINIVEKKEGCSWSTMTEREIVDVLKRDYPQAPLVVITGGEPLLQDLTILCDLLIEAGFTVSIETSGTEYQDIRPDVYVTVSPKFNNEGKRPIKREIMERADEVKTVIGTMDDLRTLEEWLPFVKGRISLQPLSAGIESTELCIDICKKRGYNLSIQTHKLLGVR